MKYTKLSVTSWKYEQIIDKFSAGQYNDSVLLPNEIIERTCVN